MSGPWEEYQKQEKKQSTDSSGPWDDYKQKRGFTAPLKEMNVEGWKKESIAYPVLQTMYGLMPFQGKQGEQQFVQGMQGIKEKGDAMVQGVKTIAQDPAAAAQAAWQAVTERPGETLGNLVKGVVYDPELLFMPVPGAKQASQAVGQAAGAVARPVIQGAKNVGGAVADVTSGAYGALRGNIARPGEIPASYQKPSVRQPVGETYYTPEQIQAWRAGELPTEQLTPKPITDLGPQAISALQRTEGNIPYAGQGWRALGEQIGETYRNPINLLTDVGLDVLTSGGLPTAARMGYKGYQGVQGARAANTLQKAGFTAMFPEEFAALQAGKPHPSAIGPVAGPSVPRAQPTMVSPVTTQPVAPQPLPQLTYNPTQPVMYASETGVVGRTPQAVVEADLAQRYAPQPVAAVAPEPMIAQPVKPLAVVEDVAKTPEQLAAEQKILDFINARRGVVPEPEPQPVAEPKKRISQEQRIREREAQMTPEELAAQQAEVERNLAKSRGKPVGVEPVPAQISTSADTLKQKMAQPKTAEDAALSEALRQRLEALKTKGGYKPPSVMEMQIENNPKKVNKIEKAEWETLDEFNNKVFLKNMGLDSNKEFIAKAKTPEGSIIRAGDKKIDSEAIEYKNGDGFMVKRHIEGDADTAPGVTEYFIFNNDGTIIELLKFPGTEQYGIEGISSIRIKKGSNIIAEGERNAGNPKRGDWLITEGNPETGYYQITESELNLSKDPQTRKLLNELPNTDWDLILEEAIARANDFKQVK